MSNIVSLADKLDEMIELVKQKQKEVNKIIQSKDRQIKELTELKEVSDSIIKAWEILPGDREYTPKEISRWLVLKMAPAINEYRKKDKSYQQKYPKP